MQPVRIKIEGNFSLLSLENLEFTSESESSDSRQSPL